MMKLSIAALLLTASWLLGCPAAAQSISLETLASLAASPVEQTLAQPPALKEWVVQPPRVPTSSELVAWSWWSPTALAGSLPDAQLTLQRNHGTLDAVLWLRRQGGLYNELRRELQRQQLLTTRQAVTCLGCEGYRYTTSDYTVVLYSGKPGHYPLMVVVHSTAAPLSSPQSRR